jgi:hypothetical protein
MRGFLAVGAAAALIAASVVTTGVGRGASQAARQSHLGGEVLLCGVGGTACAAVSAHVNLLRMKGGVAQAVAHEYARNGHFSFRVVPGEYIPAAKLVGAQARDVRCLTSRVRIGAGVYARSDVRCHHRF